MQIENTPCHAAKTYLKEFQKILECMIENMTTATLTDSISHNFIVQMIPHHQAAIEMSESILQYTKDDTLMNIAHNIITEQTKSIEEMQAILCHCEEQKNSCQERCMYQAKIQQIWHMMFSDMRNAYADDCVNCDFIREMIPHHMGAIRMSKTTCQFAICSELKPILNAIITSQEKGICQMRSLGQCLSCKKISY